MSEIKYTVHKKTLKTIDFELLIIAFPEEDIEDKLTYLSKENKMFTKTFYEDYLLTISVANLNAFFAAVGEVVSIHDIDEENSSEIEEQLDKIRDEVMERVYEVNPSMLPSNIYINRNGVLKLIPENGEYDGKLLTENPVWEQEITDEVVNEIEKGLSQEKADKYSESTQIEDLEFELVDVWWKRIGKYIKIRQYDVEECDIILNKRTFKTRRSFDTFIVTTCIDNFKELFAMIDEMGIPSRVTPRLLIRELYELCKQVNPLLEYSAVRTDESGDTGGQKLQSTLQGYVDESACTSCKKDLKTFKDVTRESLLTLEERIKKQVIGQDNAIKSVVTAIQRANIGLKAPNKPIGSFLFAGRTGTGKSITTKVLAEELIGMDISNLIIIDCSEYSADHEYAKLIGAPNGYVSHDAGGYLTNAVAKNPFSVVVFDEFEKASRKVHELLLQVLEEGRLTDGKGQMVSFKDTILIMTSNVGVDEIDKIKKTIGFGSVNVVTEERKEQAIEKAIKKKFKPEFINRLDEIIYFNTLTEDAYRKIVDLELGKLNQNLVLNATEFSHIRLHFDDAIKDYVFDHGIDSEFGARSLKRCIEKDISTGVAHILLTEDPKLVKLVEVSAKDDKPVFELVLKTKAELEKEEKEKKEELKAYKQGAE